MTDYFNFDDRPWNDDTYDREENRPRASLHDALEYDRELFNRILNYPALSDADKYNLASIFNWCAEELLETCETSRSFDEFLIEVNGNEWHDNMMRAWLKRKSMEIAKNWNCPELANTEGVFLYKEGEVHDAD